MEKALITSIYTAMYKHKLTQLAVAQKAGVHRNTLSRSLRNQSGMSLNCFAKIVEAINELKPGAWTWPGN